MEKERGGNRSREFEGIFWEFGGDFWKAGFEEIFMGKARGRGKKGRREEGHDGLERNQWLGWEIGMKRLGMLGGRRIENMKEIQIVTGFIAINWLETLLCLFFFVDFMFQ